MKKFKSYHNYDLKPEIAVAGFDDQTFEGSDELAKELERAVDVRHSKKAGGAIILSIDTYPGTDINAIEALVKRLCPDVAVNVEMAAKPAKVRLKEFADYITDDRVFGVMCHKKIDSLYDAKLIDMLRKRVEQEKQGAGQKLIVLYGFGTELIAKADIHVFADMSRWEIELRYRAGMSNWNLENGDDPTLRKFKIGYFIEWRIADLYKKSFFDSIDYVIDANDTDAFKMVTGDAFRAGIETVVTRPFRVEPYFDPGVWGGHWMQNVIGVGKEKQNLAWCFDGVPEENAINLRYGKTLLQFPAMDVTLNRPRKLLGERVHGRFGAEYPIRFDFLDTIGGENLSLQVHPLTEYIQNEFGMHYTQDESYYILDTDEEEKPVVYLGLKEGIDKQEFERDLRKSEKGETAFPADKYVNEIPAKKHDHFLIPAGTIHCSGKGCMVLEISSTPYIFTFKLWDWDRVGLDGLPRPIHVEHGLKNIQWDRTTHYVMDELVDQVTPVSEDETAKIERTGLHTREPIEVNRAVLHGKHAFKTDDSVVQGNIVDGEAVLIESPSNAFAPFTVHYAETFIIPAAVNEYTLTPLHGEAAVVLASIRR